MVQSKVSIIICCKNEAKTIGNVIKKSNKYADEVLVIDGHSDDETSRLVNKFCCKFILDEGRGKGDGIRTGIKRAKGDILVFIDADGSHEPRDIPQMIKLIKKGQADLIVASRGKGGSDELHGNFEKMLRLIGSSIITLIINLRFGYQLTDSQNGFRAIKRKVIQDLDLRENTTTIEQEMLIKALKKGYKVLEIPSHEYERKYGKSHINLTTIWPKYVWSLIKNIF